MASTNHNHTNDVSILIVDDHEVVRNGIRSYLEALTQFNVVGEAASGEEALKLVSEHIPDIVLLDLIMPIMDGNAVYEAMQADPALRDIAVVITTSDPSSAPPGVSIMKKPVSLKVLIEMVHKYCRDAAPGRE